MDAPSKSDSIRSLAIDGLSGQPHPLFPGAVFGLDDGGDVRIGAVGAARRYADLAGNELPVADQTWTTETTIFDLASLTKLFTATVVMRLAEQRLLSLDDPLSHYFETYTRGNRSQITVRQLLTHTSGLPAEIFIWRDVAEPSQRPTAVLGCPLEAEPGTRFRYSCTGYITLGLLAAQVSGQPLDDLVQEIICIPLGLEDLGFRPLDRLGEEARQRIAATECRDSSDHRGIVHDENAASLGGVSGNAGIFGTAGDLLIFGRAVLDGLVSDPTRLPLSGQSLVEMCSPQLGSQIANDYQSGLGYRIDDASFMGALAGSGQAFGHTGFTGTSLILDSARDLVLVLLTNRVHPSRDWSQLSSFRCGVAEAVAGQG